MRLADHIQIRRYLPLLLAGVPLLGIILGFDLAARQLLGRKNPSPPTPVSWEHINLAGERIAGVEAAIAKGEIDTEKLVVAFGASSVRLDLDAELLRKNDPTGRDWIVLGTAGFDLEQLEPSSWSLLNSTAKPATVVIGLHQTMLSHPPRADPNPSDGGLKSRVRDSLRKGSFLAHYRYDLNSASIPLAVHRSRSQLSGDLGHGMRAMFVPSDDILKMWTWSVSEGKDHADELHIEKQRKSFAEIARIEHFGTVAENPNLTVLAKIIGELRDQGVRVVIAMMPERSDWRDMHTPEVEQFWDAALVRLAGDGAPLEVISFRAEFGDDDFFDLAHLNRAGQKKLSRRLPAAIGDEE